MPFKFNLNITFIYLQIFEKKYKIKVFAKYLYMVILMEENFYSKRDDDNILKIRELRRCLPAFCGEFFRGIEPYTTPLTRLGYARDLKLFKDFGYEIKNARCVDMFPRTEHVECVVKIVRKDLIIK